MTPAEKRKEFVEAVRGNCYSRKGCGGCLLRGNAVLCEFVGQLHICDAEALAMFAYPDEEN